MGTKETVMKLREELHFWQRVHQYEPVDEIELRLAEQISQLENRDQFGIPRYNGTVIEPNEENFNTHVPKVIICRYCCKHGLKWKSVEGKWRLFEGSQPHTCPEYQKARKNRDSKGLLRHL